MISQSKDGGETWSTPVVIFHGSFATAPTPVVNVKGVLYRTMEGPDDPSKALVLWANASANLLDPASWHSSHGPNGSNGLLIHDVPKYPGSSFSSWQEGSLVEGPSGEVYNVLRINGQSAAVANVAAITELDVSTGTLTFKSWIRGPFGSSKFLIRKDPKSSTAQYYALSTNITKETLHIDPNARNNLVFSTSSDLIEWRVCTTVLTDDTGFDPVASTQFTGMEYPDFQIEGSDVFMAIRTAYRGAWSAGSSNRITFKWLRNFRDACHN